MRRDQVPFRSATAVVIATGPSLSDEQLEVVRSASAQGWCWTIAVNNAHERAPWSDLAYFGDYLFGKVHIDALMRTHKGRIATASRNAAERWGLQYIKASNKPGLGVGEVIHLNGNSGFQAINLATWLGALRVLLLGFDMREVDGRAHYFGQHPSPLVQTQLFGEWIHKAGALAADAKWHDIAIVNCTPGSALTCWPYRPIAEVLP